MAAVIEVEGLHKAYGDLEAVRGIDLHVDAGEVFALLGPNGAGKTTTVEILEGYRSRTAGEVAVRDRVGIVLQSTGVDPFLTVRESISMYAGYYPHPRPVDEVLEVVGLTEKRDERVKRLSGGQQRRLDVAIALAGDPELLFLDEPTTGFDPGARRAAWEIVRNLTALGKTVFLTTHYMDEAEHLANRVAVIRRGEIVAEGAPRTLGDRTLGRSTISVQLGGDGELPPALAAGDRGKDNVVRLVTTEPVRVLHDLTGWALERGVTLEALRVSQPTLEDVYLELTGGEAGIE
jgi:ABC-2 type transport system ATP-binding protein